MSKAQRNVQMAFAVDPGQMRSGASRQLALSAFIALLAFVATMGGLAHRVAGPQGASSAVTASR